ncbi:MAG: U32 family peptidase [Rikenellaceae bacterium]
MSTKLELLAPAKNYELGVEAIKCGADALYIGSEMFGARNAASNTLEDIERLVKYAHIYGVKVYVAFNTIIYDGEIKKAEELIAKLYEIDVDALIIQDMAICEMDIPPIVLHASTQTAALTPQKVKFLQDVGFERVILERAHSLSDIRAIKSECDVEIEAFIFGAICVSYSGQCYMSEAVASRSGNRGVCAQPCRSKYNLYNERDRLLIEGGHLLSVKDLNLDNSIADLITEGVVSFKIEGRLKDETYIRNSVSYFNSLLNKEIVRLNKKGGDYCRASYGTSIEVFEPQLKKSFTRGFTNYFIKGKQSHKLANFKSAKPIGEFFAKIKSIKKDRVTLDRIVSGVGGDGICYLNSEGEMCGALINKVEGDVIVLNKEIDSLAGTEIYRNHDKSFSDEVLRAKTKRSMDVEINVRFKKGVFGVEARCVNGIKFGVELEDKFEAASNVERAVESIKASFMKTGDTPFAVKRIDISGEVKFIPAKLINEIRRSFYEQLEDKCKEGYVPSERKTEICYPKFYDESVDYKMNVTNRLSRQFFEKCGVENIETGLEISKDFAEKELMRMKYCLRKEIGECLKEGGKYKELYIENNGRKFNLNFDCRKCEMFITLRQE